MPISDAIIHLPSERATDSALPRRRHRPAAWRRAGRTRTPLAAAVLAAAVMMARGVEVAWTEAGPQGFYAQPTLSENWQLSTRSTK
jgi:hypothetical protein